MTSRSLAVGLTIVGTLIGTLGACGDRGAGETAANPCQANPCAAKAANPCAAPATAAMLDASLVTQGARSLYTGLPRAELVARGKALWSNTSLSRSGTMSCSTCHGSNYGQMQASFATPYPHRVAMAKDRAGLDQVNAAEMVQLCMMIPMNNDPLAWDSPELAALAAYVEDIRPGFKPGMGASANPCAAKGGNPCAVNPCAMKKGANPCAVNPCAMKKGANPCAVNPCAPKAKAKNPCKPT